MDISEYIQRLLNTEKFAEQVTYHKISAEKDSSYELPKRPWSKALENILHNNGIHKLYSHQAIATDYIRAGYDVITTTPTASGKTLIYNIPVLERFLSDPDSRALYIFPLKALAQDQKNAFIHLCESLPKDACPTIEIYDGDTSDYQRKKIRNNPPTVLITTPEMLHLGILPSHDKWTTFLASLSFIILDEAHTYRGVMGSHMAQVLQRLQRITHRYNSHPVHILCTATVGNPEELGKNLIGPSHRIKVIQKSGAPQGKRHFLFMDPVNSPSTLAIELLHSAICGELRTIIYCRSRRITELISIWATGNLGKYTSKISAYRSGYLPEERREIEKKMSSGELLAVISTSALELGIDIGNLDLCILVGYPGSIMSTLQRGGRVGRKGQESAVILIGGEDALDQFFIHNPEEFFNRSPENAVLNPFNEVILSKHLECAASELPLTEGENWLQNNSVSTTVSALEEKGTLLRTADGSQWLASRKRPQRDVDLRGSGSSFYIQDTSGNIIGSVDAHQAFRETHKGAVYLHHGQTYVINELDLGEHKAIAAPEKVPYFTNVRTSKSTEILSVWEQRMVFSSPVFLGKLRVTENFTGFEKRNAGSQKLIEIAPLDLPPQIFETEGIWFTIPDRERITVEDNLYHFMGSIHAMEHICIGLMPLLIMADRNDLGGISIPMHPQTGLPSVFIYDGLPGGAGLVRSAFPLLENLLTSARKTLISCPCETGCPSCIQSPKCGSGNRPLDKAGCLFLLDTILQEQPHLHDLIPPSVAEQNKKENKLKKDGPVMVFDVETRRSADEVGGWNNADMMGVSIAVVWDGTQYRSFRQEKLGEMAELLKQAGLVVGYNSYRFDYSVISPFFPYPPKDLPGLDLLDYIKSKLHYTVSLDNIGNSTLGIPKSSNGLQALEWWKTGEWEKIETYCIKDVEITLKLYEFGRDNGYILFTNKAGQKVRIPVDWKE